MDLHTARPDLAAAPDLHTARLDLRGAGLDRLVRAAGPSATAVTLVVARGDLDAVHCHGRTDHGGEPCTPDTAFELGSVSKTFTALLLAAMADRGEVGPADPVERHLPDGWRPATVRVGGPIRLLHLATHTSGLPTLPPGLLARSVPAFLSNPYATFGDEQLRASLARTTVRHRPGERMRYSNYGVGLLGRLLAEAAGTPYAELVERLICRPFGLTATSCLPDGPGRAVGHLWGRPLPSWRIPGLPGAAAVRSGGADMLRYLRAHLSPGDGPLGPALREVQRPRLRLPGSDDGLCLIWNHRRIDGRDHFFHAGATRGFTSFVGFCPQTGSAVAALTNVGPTAGNRFVQQGYETLRRLSA
ncbi:serine hydrolase domain-containing protein [Kitasatospora sp. NPDC004240]